MKINRSGDNTAILPHLKNGKLTATNAPMTWILQVAGLSYFLIEGPAWPNADRFDLSATSPPAVPDTAIKPMLQYDPAGPLPRPAQMPGAYSAFPAR